MSELHQEFLPQAYTNTVESGSVAWKSPSNIALVKYWGKHGQQLPKNTSISFTLDHCATSTRLAFDPKSRPGFDITVLLDGKPQADFVPKIEKFFSIAGPYLPFLEDYSFTLHTSNSFPHSSGIASSASGMSALALCLLEIESQLLETPLSDTDFKKKASFLARLGSGSAARSIDGGLVVWGAHEEIPGSSDLFAIPYPDMVHEVFRDFCDTVLLVDTGEKVVSSTVGHGLMHDHPFASQRFDQAQSNMLAIKPILATGDLDAFIALVESEALSLHAMMLTSSPYFILMKPATLAIINKIWSFRKETGIPACFTLDAGANVHLLYPAKHKEAVRELIESQLKPHCKEGAYIHDQVGAGAVRL
ncbi:diphosphomevalonate/mevalonate 3,5-bisphosphate decarboxylase family protein [Gilvibacter sediminis]|uniref:diphosphomevalonate/mevalonate 3,5-bisphosphate decarboxylase family protein n=1 Tax=Gilvibacter sediminis TaxID=379071 RepID=UPI0023505DE8|nr:diphosphomevalonate decarboxylase [Gilvibacter sediminis]MDC7997336.1 diphosphomevalonate decarboxylase [Gilvibacter sediminis]